MTSPYRVGRFVDSHHFYGRQGLIADLLGAHHQCIYLLGNRKVGKTSLLRYLEERAPSLALFLDLDSGKGNPVSPGHGLALAIKKKARQFPLLERYAEVSGSGICDVLEDLIEVTSPAGLDVLLLLDEGEALLDLDDAVLKRLRGLLQQDSAMRTIVAASKGLCEMDDRCRFWRTSPFLLGFEVEYIPPLSTHDAEDLIRQTNNPRGTVRVDNGLIAEIADLTGGHPYLLQHLCNKLFLSEGWLRAINARDLIVDDQLSRLFQSDYDSLSRPERDILHHVANSDSTSTNEIADKAQLRIEDAQSYLSGLERIGYLREDSEVYRINGRLLKTWFRMGRAKETEASVSSEAALRLTADPAKLGQIAMSPDLYQRLHAALLSCGPFDSQSRLQDFFAHPSIQPWQTHLPESTMPAGRVTTTINYLANKRRTDTHKNALALFVAVLSQRIDPLDECSVQLAGLAEELAHWGGGHE